MHSVIIAAIIIHNMIVEEKRHRYKSYEDYRDELFEDEDYHPPTVFYGRPLRSDWIAQRSQIMHLQNSFLSRQLQADLVDHIWNTKGDEEEMGI